MILFDRESVKGRSGTCHGFASDLNFRYKQLVTLVWMLRTEKKTGKIGRKSMLRSKQNV